MARNRQKVKVNPFTFWRNLVIFGTFFKVNFPKNYTSNEAQTPKEPFFVPFIKSQKWSKISITIWRFLGL